LNQEQSASLADAMEQRFYPEGSRIITQGDIDTEMFVVMSGRCQAERQIGDDVQKHRDYRAGDRFGEKAFMEGARRAATVIACTDVEVLCLKRSKFRRMLGPFHQLQQEHYMHDPRKLIADFYRTGGTNGPLGVSAVGADGGETNWFAVYRPCSRDAIAKMLSGDAVGKGLNVKGKSSKKNHLSGFVPFLQISDNRHKADIEDSPPDSRLTVYYQTEEARFSAWKVLEPLLQTDSGLELAGDPTVEFVDTYPDVFGLTMHERVLREAYINQSSIEFLIGWETGRASLPPFMDMNLHAVRWESEPNVVLYQYDIENAMNPHGLLIAYAEASVKPVVSDFDTFTIGSRGMSYDPLPLDQQQLALGSLDKTEQILRGGSSSSWNTQWLNLMKTSDSQPKLPKFGFGDATSIRLIEAAVLATQESGAIRHGAECFNFGFPQELDDEFLVIWENFDNKPWRYKDPAGLRTFLLDRIREGFSFPLNPVWPVRDAGWYEVYTALRDSPATKGPFDAWYPPESGITERVEAIHRDFPSGFRQNLYRHSSTSANLDLSSLEAADLAMHKAARRWRQARSVIKVSRMSLMPSRTSSAKQSVTSARTSTESGGAATSLPSFSEIVEDEDDEPG